MCNVGGLGETFKCRLFKYFHEKDVHVALIQETHFTKKTHGIWQSKWGGEIFFNDGKTNACGIAILFDRKIKIDNVQVQRHHKGQILIVQVMCGEICMDLNFRSHGKIKM